MDLEYALAFFLKVVFSAVFGARTLNHRLQNLNYFIFRKSVPGVAGVLKSARSGLFKLKI